MPAWGEIISSEHDVATNAKQVKVVSGSTSAGTIADGADVAQGAVADAVVAAGAAGTLSAKLRRLTTDLDSVKTNTNIPTTVGHGRKTVTAAGTAEALAGSTACKSVIVTAETDNTGIIVVGGSGVLNTLASRTGTPLNPGESCALDISNLSAVFIDASVSTDGVTYTYTA